MARCHQCRERVPDGVSECPRCHAVLLGSPLGMPGIISPFEARLGLGRESGSRGKAAGRWRVERAAAGRRLLVGCLLATILVLGGMLALVLIDPGAVRHLLAERPTPLPATPRPTATPSPAPSPTPVWTRYAGSQRSFFAAFPPSWVVINFTTSAWKRRFETESSRYSWLEGCLTDARRQEAVEMETIWAFDPSREGHFSVQCHLRQDLAGMTAEGIRDALAVTLQSENPTVPGGRVMRAVRADLAQVGGRPAALLEMLVLPNADSTVDQSIKLQVYALADRNRGYWIEMMGVEGELERDAGVVRAILDAFRIVE